MKLKDVTYLLKVSVGYGKIAPKCWMRILWFIIVVDEAKGCTSKSLMFFITTKPKLLHESSSKFL